jgi:hypothetical protein
VPRLWSGRSLNQGRVQWLASYEEGNGYDFGAYIKRAAH